MSKYFRIAVHCVGNVLRAGKLLYYRLLGVNIGRNTMISLSAKIDVHRGHVSIGDNCLITACVVILSHDEASRMILENNTGAGSVLIGNNAYVGVNAKNFEECTNRR